MSQLANAGLVSCFQYATVTAGRVNYYKPTALGFKLVFGPNAQLPSRAFFREVSLSLQPHTRALADFVVATYAAAETNQTTIKGFYRENQLELSLGGKCIRPDCAFQLQLPDGRSLNYVVEIDCGTEPIRSTRERESLQQKARFYDAYQSSSDKRFRVVVLFTKPSARVAHFADVARSVVSDQQRTLFYTGFLDHYTKAANPLTDLLFEDRYERRQSLIPESKLNHRFAKSSNLLANAQLVC